MNRGTVRIEFWLLVLLMVLATPALHAQYMGGYGRGNGSYGNNNQGRYGNNNNQGRYGNNNNQGRYGNNNNQGRYGNNNNQGGYGNNQGGNQLYPTTPQGTTVAPCGNQQGGNQQGGNQQGGNQQGGGGILFNNMYMKGVLGLKPTHPSVALVPTPLLRIGTPYSAGGAGGGTPGGAGGGTPGGAGGGTAGGAGGGTTVGGLGNYARINIRSASGLLAAAKTGGGTTQPGGGTTPPGGGTTPPRGGTTTPGGGTTKPGGGTTKPGGGTTRPGGGGPVAVGSPAPSPRPAIKPQPRTMARFASPSNPPPTPIMVERRRNLRLYVPGGSK